MLLMQYLLAKIYSYKQVKLAYQYLYPKISEHQPLWQKKSKVVMIAHTIQRAPRLLWSLSSHKLAKYHLSRHSPQTVAESQVNAAMKAPSSQTKNLLQVVVQIATRWTVKAKRRPATMKVRFIFQIALWLGRRPRRWQSLQQVRRGRSRASVKVRVILAHQVAQMMTRRRRTW